MDRRLSVQSTISYLGGALKEALERGRGGVGDGGGEGGHGKEMIEVKRAEDEGGGGRLGSAEQVVGSGGERDLSRVIA